MHGKIPYHFSHSSVQQQLSWALTVVFPQSTATSTLVSLPMGTECTQGCQRSDIWQMSAHGVNIRLDRTKVAFHLTFLPPGEEVSGGGVLVMFNGLEPQLEGEEPLILLQQPADQKGYAKENSGTGFVTLLNGHFLIISYLIALQIMKYLSLHNSHVAVWRQRQRERDPPAGLSPFLLSDLSSYLKTANITCTTNCNLCAS